MKRHYWLISFTTNVIGSPNHTVSLGECTVDTTFKYIGVGFLNQIKMNILKQAISEGCVADYHVSITSVSYLGEMTQEEWEE